MQAGKALSYLLRYRVCTKGALNPPPYQQQEDQQQSEDAYRGRTHANGKVKKDRSQQQSRPSRSWSSTNKTDQSQAVTRTKVIFLLIGRTIRRRRLITVPMERAGASWFRSAHAHAYAKIHFVCTCSRALNEVGISEAHPNGTQTHATIID